MGGGDEIEGAGKVQYLKNASTEGEILIPSLINKILSSHQEG